MQAIRITLSVLLVLASVHRTTQEQELGKPDCLEGKNSCTACYGFLVKEVLKSDENQFNLQMAFFPPNQSDPAFVTIFYDYFNDTGRIDRAKYNTKIWYWSTSTYYLFQPLPVLQYTSLFFSDPALRHTTLHLTLNASCYDADKYMMLLTQRVS